MPNTVEEKWYLKLSREQRLELLREIWASLTEEKELSGAALLEECERRLGEMNADPSKRITWDELCAARGWKA